MKTRICIVCQKEFEVLRLSGGKYSKRETCSKDCANTVKLKNMQATNINKYGHISAMGNNAVRDKRRSTMLKNHGVEHPIQAKHIREKYEDTMLERFGVTCNFANKENFQKSIDTMLRKYGVKRPVQTKEYKEKMIEKYGVENPMQSEDIRYKFKTTMFDTYGFGNPSQVQNIKDKKKQKSFKNFGVEYPAQSEEVKEKIKQTNMQKYGVEYPMQSKEVREKAMNTWIENIRSGKTKAGTSKMEFKVKDALPHLEHQYKHNGYRFDFYDPTRNIHIEISGIHWHVPNGSDTPRQKSIAGTFERDKYKRSLMGDKLLTIYFSDEYTTLEHMCDVIESNVFGVIASDKFSSKRLDEFNVIHETQLEEIK